MTLLYGSFACPKTASPDYWDDECVEYIELGNYNFNCVKCSGTLKIINPFLGQISRCLT